MRISTNHTDSQICDRQVLYTSQSVDVPGFLSTVKTPLMLRMKYNCIHSNHMSWYKDDHSFTNTYIEHA